MKKALKKIFALVVTGAMAVSAFAMSASAAHYMNRNGYCYSCGEYHYAEYPAQKYSKWCSVCQEYHYGYTHDYFDGYCDEYGYWKDGKYYWYDSYYQYGCYGYYDKNGNWHWYDYDDSIGYGYYSAAYLTAENWAKGKITVKVPTGATGVSYSWTGSNITGTSGESVTITNRGAYSATCTVTFTYKVSASRTVTDTVKVSISGTAFSKQEDAKDAGKLYSYSSNHGYYYDGIKYPCDYYDPSYVIPSRYDYEVNWDTDTFYYNGKKQVPTATVTIGKRTIELNVSIISGDKDSTDVGSYRASATLPAGYRGYKLSGSTLRYTIEEPLKQGLTTENGSVYYYNNGKAVTGWKTVGNDTYYFEKDGKAATGWEKLDGKWYYFDTTGIMQTGWVRTGGKTYYTNTSGVMVASKWMKLDGYWYYFGETGAMAESEWVQTGGKWYYLAADGKMATNTTIPGGYRVDANGVWVK